MKEKILIVDDQVSFCNHIQAALNMEGYRAVVTHNAKQALAEKSLSTRVSEGRRKAINKKTGK